MQLFIYNFLRLLYLAAARVLALFNKKAEKWINGRKNWEQHFRDTLQEGEKRIWIHCSSTGEFEQARPLIEALRSKYPAYKVVLTFFSPSGYEACLKNNPADYIFYLPNDSSRNARRFVGIVQPSLVMFIKYEFWYYYLQALKANGIPALMVSGAFRQEQQFFKWYGRFFRDMLHSFSFFFLQDKESERLLNTIGIDKNILISGDTRYDRVMAIAQQFTPIDAVVLFKGNSNVLIAGSTHSGDEEIILACFPTLPADWKLIIAPHEISTDHISKLKEAFDGSAVLFSELDAEHTGADKKVLIINNIGMLSRLFAYGDIAFIGGGFQKGGIHNILEPAAFAVPVIFGTIYEKFVEAKEMASLGYVFPVNNAAECSAMLNKLITDEVFHKRTSDSLRSFMQQHTGATQLIMNELDKHGWLK